MNRLAGKLKQNKGVTLVELIVAIAILSIVSITLISFLTLGVNQYRRQTEDVAIQRQNQMVQTQIRDILSDANREIYAADDASVNEERELMEKFRLANGKIADAVLIVLNSEMIYSEGFDPATQPYSVSAFFITFFKTHADGTGEVYYNELHSKDIISGNQPIVYSHIDKQKDLWKKLVKHAYCYDETLFPTKMPQTPSGLELEDLIEWADKIDLDYVDCTDWPKLAEHVESLHINLVKDAARPKVIVRVDTAIRLKIGDNEQNIEHSVALRNLVNEF